MPEKFDDFAIRLHPTDDVAVLKRTVKAGTELRNGSVQVTAAKTIPAGHKMALGPIHDGAEVRRYGQIIGFAQGAIDVFIDQMQVRTDNGSGAATRLSPYVKDRLANAVAKVRSCRARMEQMMAYATSIVERRELISVDARIHYMLDMARIGRECEEAVLLLYKCCGARGVYKSNPIQRYLRDTLVAANHITQDADNNAAALGGYLLSGDLPPLLYSKPDFS